ncbi:methylenetetrahydrofolate reductase [NAD(P)H] [Vicingaceae bacterium]|nr:methylenetetrahydrofolate reductase [NAD(P)H] [Vicingaceae bacterium]MDB4060879.1 methylenetetrahydrofolate reductase [NAD(P)H] [Vicingaceae bacterium]MDC1450820.1 methylenetetrahydrofolate reductase [NAD(P)H] [Vicingaceae bacterium]
MIELLKSTDKPLFSFEILPPLKGKSIQSIYDGIDPLMEFKPAFVNVTYHREEFIYKKREKGFLEKIAIKKRPGTVGICAAIMNKYDIEAIPHLICGGFNKEETENALIDLNFLGINNVLALRGDPIKTESHFVPELGGNEYAVDLVKQIVELNNGNYMDENIENATPTNFSIGVAGYPEKHFESPNFSNDIKRLKEKIDAGADYVVTQLFYDNKKFFDFVDACRLAGIDVPIIPGIKPIESMRHITFLPKFFNIDLPSELTDELDKCKSDVAVKQVGAEWAIQQSKELIERGSPCLHFYTMGKSTTVKQIAQSIF